ncbi:MAG TPA: hypothetical protein PK358_10760 [Spirochaetota bacterium]|nr:hypothetical protein [Spirochaetota bacterium]HPJ35307.1 hypothetical protein [Spirochaetota bacterium]
MDDTEYTSSIADMLKALQGRDKNSIKGIFIDETLSEFYLLENEITVPRLPVKEIDIKNSHDISSQLVHLFPEYLEGHSFIKKRKPASEQHALHFIRPIEGRVIDFIHIIRFDFRFYGKRGAIVLKGDNENYPSYATDMIYFKSQLVPVYKGSDPAEIDSIRLRENFEVETDRRLFTSVIFDEFSTKEISIELSRRAGPELFRIPVKIYPFINYEYFTACFNIPDPSFEKVNASAEIYEPVFLYLYFGYRSSSGDITVERALELNDMLESGGEGVVLKPEFILDLKDFFSSYTLETDDELLLKGWKRFEIN